MVSASALVLLCFSAFLLKQASCEKKAYIQGDIPSVPCIDSPLKDICPLDHKIPDYSKLPDQGEGSINRTTLMSRLSMIAESLNRTGANASCKATVRTLTCRFNFLYVCKDDDDFLSVDEKISETCKKIGEECSAAAAGLVKFSICSTAISIPKIPRRGHCVDFPEVKDDPYPCPQRNYKVATPDRNFTAQMNRQRKLHLKLKESANKTNEECRSKVAETVCTAVAPACTKDEKKIVDLISKQDCRKIMGCLNATKNNELIEEANGLCEDLADGSSATTTDVNNVYGPGNEAATKEAINKLLWLAFVYIASLAINV